VRRYRKHDFLRERVGLEVQMVGVSTEMDTPPRISARSFGNLAEVILTHEPRGWLDDENEVRVSRIEHTGKEARNLEEKPPP
jgi:hypothetical protein